jgi:hypothetical protein
MAGHIRQHIDVASLERYISQHVGIQTPISVTQVNHSTTSSSYNLRSDTFDANMILFWPSLDLASQIRPI